MNIKTIMHNKNLMQKDLSAALGVNKNTVINWFNNKKGIRAEQVPAIAKFLNINISVLYGEMGNERPFNNNIELNARDGGMVDLLKEQLKEERQETDRLKEEIFELKNELKKRPNTYSQVAEGGAGCADVG